MIDQSPLDSIIYKDIVKAQRRLDVDRSRIRRDMATPRAMGHYNNTVSDKILSQNETVSQITHDNNSWATDDKIIDPIKTS